MPSVFWPLLYDRPIIQVSLQLALANQTVARTLLADSGAGSLRGPFELILDEDDCLLCGGIPIRDVSLGGAYAGAFPVYLLEVRIPELAFDDAVPAVGVPQDTASIPRNRVLEISQPIQLREFCQAKPVRTRNIAALVVDRYRWMRRRYLGESKDRAITVPQPPLSRRANAVKCCYAFADETGSR